MCLKCDLASWPWAVRCLQGLPLSLERQFFRLHEPRETSLCDIVLHEVFLDRSVVLNCVENGWVNGFYRVLGGA